MLCRHASEFILGFLLIVLSHAVLDGVLRAVLRSEKVQRATAEEIAEKFSNQGLSLAHEKRFSCNELKHLDDDKKWKVSPTSLSYYYYVIAHSHQTSLRDISDTGVILA